MVMEFGWCAEVIWDKPPRRLASTLEGNPTIWTHVPGNHFQCPFNSMDGRYVVPAIELENIAIASWVACLIPAIELQIYSMSETISKPPYRILD